MRNLTVALIIGFFCIACVEDDTSFSFDDIDVSTGSSTARFHIYGDILYVVEDQSLSIFDISDNILKTRLSKNALGQNVETIFRYNDILFLGTTTGVIFIEVSNPNFPVEISSYTHLTSCDPVVSNGQYAFSTLRAGNRCGNGTNALDIIDIKNISNPILIKSIEMTSPYGVGLLGNHLFVGEGVNGMRWLDVTDPENVIQKGIYTSITAKDFIIDGDIIIANTLSGIIQMKISETDELIVISQMKYD